MKTRELQRYLKEGGMTVAREVYAITRVTRPCTDSFAIIRDEKEITCVIDEKKASGRNYSGFDGGWRRLTFDMVLPFDLVGFFAYLTAALAAAGIPIFALSSYSTDHFFVKDHDLEKAVKTLEGLGLTIRRK